MSADAQAGHFERCPVAGGSEAGYCRCVREAGHDGEHLCQHGWME